MSLKRGLLLWYHGITPEHAAYLASKEWLLTREWDVLRYAAYEENDGRCEVCARSKHELPEGVYLNADHIKSRLEFPWLAKKLSNLQVLCSSCNRGKGNRRGRDWRHPDHPHREAE